jgi:hypothetical protein
MAPKALSARNQGRRGLHRLLEDMTDARRIDVRNCL